jgi:hypothetical protein
MTRDAVAMPWLVLGGGAVAALAWRYRHRASGPSAPPVGIPAASAPWVFPVPTFADREAVISNGFRSPPQADGRATHLGVDLMFPRRDARDLIAVYPPATGNGSKGYFMPDGVPAVAASAGLVAFAKVTGTGGTVIVRHPSGYATYYTHLSALGVTLGQPVAAGQPIGGIGASPTDPAHLKHLHFELWEGGTRSGAVDPAPYLAAWSRLTIASWRPGTPIASGPRNAGLVYRPVGTPGERYPSWLHRARGASGVYVIRERGGSVVYVGQSSAGKLYETVTRHFQRWRRYKGFWRGQYAEGHDPGLTYDRDSVEVAIKVTSPSVALDEEARLIRRLRPRDNLLGQPERDPDLDEVPF